MQQLVLTERSQRAARAQDCSGTPHHRPPSAAAQVGDIFNALAVKGLQSKTAIILAGKHGNSPANVKTLRRVDSNVFNTVRADWS